MTFHVSHYASAVNRYISVHISKQHSINEGGLILARWYRSEKVLLFAGPSASADWLIGLAPFHCVSFTAVRHCCQTALWSRRVLWLTGLDEQACLHKRARIGPTRRGAWRGAGAIRLSVVFSNNVTDWWIEV